MTRQTTLLATVAILLLFISLMACVLGLGMYFTNTDEPAKAAGNYTVHQWNWKGSIETDALNYTSVGDILVQDKMTSKWVLIRGPARVDVNNPNCVKILQPQQQHPKGTKI